MSSNPNSLQEVLDGIPDLVDHLYNDTLGTHSRIRGGLSPVPPEWSSWRDEQRAWRQSAVLFDQSHHMPELFLSGPDALRLLKRVGVNSLENWGPGVAKQFVACNPRGQMIGECVLHDLGGTYELISGKPILNWVQFHAETGGYDVSIERDEATWENPTGKRVNFRFGLDGPNAGAIFDEVVEGEAPEIKFFHSTRVRIAGVDVMVLRHGMAGHRGYEISGPYEAGPTLRQALLTAGEKHGLKPGGAKAYFSSALESGWISYPLPGIYTNDDMAAYRAWLPADAWEGRFQLGGSFYSSNVEDYYTTPFDLGLKRIVKFDHDFIGREALEAIADNPPRTRVTLEWNKEDVVRVFASQLEPGPTYKAIEWPTSDYAQIHRDAVHGTDGKFIGLSTHGGYTVNEKAAISGCFIASEYAAPGTEVVLTWGEPGGCSRKPTVEKHEQTQIRATVHPVPYARTVRELKYSDYTRSLASAHGR
jgi:vanillate/3-O-methylgallate O-demethylase